jgi:hypothetical protein
MFVIVMNGTNLVQDGQNNKLVYKFPNSIIIKDKFISVASISMFYSWFNITAAENNNTFTYIWVAGTVGTIYNIVIPDGLWDVDAINKYCQFEFIKNGTYIIASSAENLYPFEILVNVNRYAIQLNTYYVPDPGSIPITYTYPSNFPGLPTVGQNCVVSFPAAFNDIVGYTEDFASAENVSGGATFPTPTASSNYATKNSSQTISYLSNKAPQIQPNSNILLALSNINNPYSQPSSIIYSLNSSVGIGELINEQPPNFMWNKMIDGTYNELRLTFLTPLLKPITINDPTMTILLTIRDKNELL